MKSKNGAHYFCLLGKYDVGILEFWALSWGWTFQSSARVHENRTASTRCCRNEYFWQFRRRWTRNKVDCDFSLIGWQSWIQRLQSCESKKMKSRLYLNRLFNSIDWFWKDLDWLTGNGKNCRICVRYQRHITLWSPPICWITPNLMLQHLISKMGEKVIPHRSVYS